MVKIELDIKNRTFIFLAILFVFIIGIGMIKAIGSLSPNVNGHSYDEIGIPTSCSSGNFLQFNNGKWECGSATNAVNVMVVVGSDTTGENGNTVKVQCPSNTKLISGGYQFVEDRPGCDEIYRFAAYDYPDFINNNWVLNTPCFKAHTYAVCLKN